MLQLCWLIPALPVAGFVILALFGSSMRRTAVAILGVSSIGLSALVSILITIPFFGAPPPGNSYTQVLWTWIDVANFRPQIAFYLDALSLTMTVVITFVSFFIHLYSTEFMMGDEGYSRFFAYMNLFVGSMVTLVLADNLLLLYLGWEGVGLCSYLLIGFWYQDPANGLAARKAFIVTRAGDTAMAVGLFLLFHTLGTLQIQEVMSRAAGQWPSGSVHAVAAAALLLGGAVGKSAQLPLQTWLPDAMAGPTPTSALIHAATMVTAGVYLIARTHTLFTMAPAVLFTVAVIGAATLLLSGFSALAQRDIKRVLAYSTISQIGYMFLALGVGAWTAAIFHFMTHAFFKALLFLAAGIVIQALHHEHDMFKMGGLRKELPVAFWMFLIGGSALAGLPLITAGFYSKDLIVWETIASPLGSPGLWIVASFGVFLTSLYTFRLIFLVFFGPVRTRQDHPPGPRMIIPVVVLAILSVVGGFVETPHGLGGIRLFSSRLGTVLPSLPAEHAGVVSESMSQLTAAAAFFLGLLLAWLLFERKPELSAAVSANAFARRIQQFWYAGWGFDWLYDKVFVQPILWFARVDKSDFVDSIYDGIAEIAELSYRALRVSETGYVRWYAAGIGAGAVILIAVVMFL